MTDSKLTTQTSNEALEEQWEVLRAAAPPTPTGLPSEQELELLKSHKARVQTFLASLTTEQRGQYVGRSIKREHRLDLERKRKTNKKEDSDRAVAPVVKPPERAPVDSTPRSNSETAEALGASLGSQPRYFTKDGSSWIIHVKQFLKTPNADAFQSQWELHPKAFHHLELFGRTVSEQRWSQSWGHNYQYSGSTNTARSLDESAMVRELIDRTNALVSGILPRKPYNGCLQNWYQVDHQIGLHSDDERSLQPGCPIFSLTWGGERRFLFKARKDSKSECFLDCTEVELYLQDGDLLVMGGTVQQTHKHTVPKWRKTKDPPTSNRINWTIRAFRAEPSSDGLS